jgi:hypothetical protein
MNIVNEIDPAGYQVGIEFQGFLHLDRYGWRGRFFLF